MWGVHGCSRFTGAVDLCRIHAVFGAERNFLDSKKSCALYLAGVTFGELDSHEV